MKIHVSYAFCIAAALALFGAKAAAQVTTTITFEGTGEENGVTENGTTTFSFKGSNWSGGTVRTLGVPPLYSSGVFSYIVGSTGAQVLFDQPMTGVNFFYASGSSVPAGTARAFDSGGNEVGAVTTGGMRSFTTATPIAKVTFSGGAIDDFSYTTVPPPPFVFDFAAAEGNWLNPGTERQGLMFDHLPANNLLVMAWFTYTAMAVQPTDPPPSEIGGPGQAWMVANLVISGNTATGDLVVHEGGAFDQPPTAFIRARTVGSMSIEFTACDAGMVSYQINDPPLTNQFPIVPLEKFVNPQAFTCQ